MAIGKVAPTRVDESPENRAHAEPDCGYWQRQSRVSQERHDLESDRAVCKNYEHFGGDYEPKDRRQRGLAGAPAELSRAGRD